MILTIGVFVIAAIAALLAWGRLGPALALPGLQKENLCLFGNFRRGFRGHNRHQFVLGVQTVSVWLPCCSGIDARTHLWSVGMG